MGRVITMLEDAVARSRSVPPDATIDRWTVQVATSSRFLIQIESLAGVGAVVQATNSIAGQADTVLLTVAPAAAPSGPHLLVINADFRAVELRSSPAQDPSQTSCDISYTVKWL